MSARERKGDESVAGVSLEDCLIFARRQRAWGLALGMRDPKNFALWLHRQSDWDAGSWEWHTTIADYLRQHPATTAERTAARTTLTKGLLEVRSAYDLETHLKYAEWRAAQPHSTRPRNVLTHAQSTAEDSQRINDPVDYAWMNYRTGRRDVEIKRWLSGAEIPAGRRGRISVGRSKHQLWKIESYLKHLRQRGVSVPSIQRRARELKRTGEADAAIDMFLLSGEGARECPDCGGQGFYYPAGEGSGARMCRHHRLLAA